MGFSSKNNGVGCHILLQGIFSTQGSNPYLLQLLYCRQILYFIYMCIFISPKLNSSRAKSVFSAAGPSLRAWNRAGRQMLTGDVCSDRGRWSKCLDRQTLAMFEPLVNHFPLLYLERSIFRISNVSLNKKSQGTSRLNWFTSQSRLNLCRSRLLRDLLIAG